MVFVRFIRYIEKIRFRKAEKFIQKNIDYIR